MSARNPCMRCLTQCLRTPPAHQLIRRMGLVTRHWERKRFYQNVTVHQHQLEDGAVMYGICLDHRKLRTPARKLFLVGSEGLAHAVAQEWGAQQQLVQPSLMHLTAICNTVIDNPHNVTREEQVLSLLPYLDSDTVRYRATEPDDLVAMQQEEWDPLIKWFNERYGAELVACSSLLSPAPPTIPASLLAYLHHLDSWAFAGFEQAVDSSKSMVLSCALFCGHIGPETTSQLARLETRHQVSRWGAVEWQHGVEAADLTSRLAASVLLRQLA